MQYLPEQFHAAAAVLYPMTANDLRSIIVNAAELALVSAILGLQSIYPTMAELPQPGAQRGDVVTPDRPVRQLMNLARLA